MGDILLKAIRKGARQQKGGADTTNQYVGNHWARRSSFLIEMGYMSNSAEDVLLSAKPYQQQLATGMANGICGLAPYLGLISP